jgi:hypothetical protein
MDRGEEGLPGGGFRTRSSGANRPPHAGPEDAPIDRRCFLKWGAAAGTWALSAPLLRDLGWPDGALDASSGQAAAPGVRIVRAGCPSHNCGGRCLLTLHVRGGVIVRIDTDDRPADTFEAPQLRACARGRPTTGPPTPSRPRSFAPAPGAARTGAASTIPIGCCTR